MFAVSWADAVTAVFTVVYASAACALLGFLWHQTREQRRAADIQSSIASYDLAVRQLIEFKRDFAKHPYLLDKDDWKDSDNSVSGVPVGMSTSDFLVFARGIWMFSFVFSVLDDEMVLLTPSERQALANEIALWLSDVPGFRRVWEAHTRKLEVHNQRFRRWVDAYVWTNRWRTGGPIFPQSVGRRETRIRPS